jgi:bifunctional protein TilS/HprT
LNIGGVNPETKGREFKRWEEVRFAHRSEQEFARLLDFYDIRWLYEPVSFDIAWDKKGNPVSKFTPDFYLPEYDLYIEITTMNQKLVTKKNRKIRRLNELYPEVKCRIFYRKDYRHLLFKYNITLEGL